MQLQVGKTENPRRFNVSTMLFSRRKIKLQRTNNR